MTKPNSDDTALYELRRKNLVALIEERGLSRLARAVGLTPTAIGHYAKDRRTVTEKAAKKIERGAKLPPGWLSRHHNEGEVAALAAPATELSAELLAKCVAAVQPYSVTIGANKTAEIVTEVYMRAIETGTVEPDPAYVQRLVKLAGS